MTDVVTGTERNGDRADFSSVSVMPPRGRRGALHGRKSVGDPDGSYEFPATGGGDPEVYLTMGISIMVLAAGALFNKKRLRVSK